MEKILFSGSSDQKTAKALAKEAKIKFGRILIKKFACNEKYIQLVDEVKGKTVYIYQTFSDNPDEILMETFLIVEAARENGAKEITLISPLLLYSRQDKKTSPENQEPVSSKLLARLYQTAGINKIITCHLHSQRVLNFYQIEVLNLKVEHLFAKEIKKIIKGDKNWQVLAPDEGSKESAQRLANFLGNLKFGFFKKRRQNPAKKMNAISSLLLQIQGKEKNIILFDDMIDTGQTVLQAKAILEKWGAKKIILAATHPILSDNAKEKLEKTEFFKIFFSNSIPLKKKVKNLKIINLLPEIKKYL